MKRRIMVLDGSMGVMIQGLGLNERDFHVDCPAAKDQAPVAQGSVSQCQCSHEMKGNNDILCLTRPDLIRAIHRDYLMAGADIITTNTFSAQAISQAEYGTVALVKRINQEGASLARKEADRMMALTPEKPRFVAGSMGPTGKMSSISVAVDDPAGREVDYDTLFKAYKEQAQGLISGGVDMLLIETIFDTLNAKAAAMAAQEAAQEAGRRVPLVFSVTVNDQGGRLLSGQHLEAFLATMAHFRPLALGLNCSFGAEKMRPFIELIAEKSPFPTIVYPNAGLPNAQGQYDESPEMMASTLLVYAKEGLLNIVGGCCGSTPEHIRQIAKAVEGVAPRRYDRAKRLGAWLAGLDAFQSNGSFINVGERCNVAGSRKFLRLIGEKQYDEALAIAKRQVLSGAMLIDVNMDDGLLNAKAQMTRFLRLLASDEDTARVPVMIDSSDFEVIREALKNVQGKAVVNSISLKEGEDVFLEHADVIRRFGAAVVVMAFDEKGQATTLERKFEICQRAYRLLTEKAGFPARDIIFDPNVLTICTGMREHSAYGRDFLLAVQAIKEHLPEAKVSGGVSNLSFAFRGNNFLREAMHSVFLYEAKLRGMDMAIVNPAQKVMYDDIPGPLLRALQGVILCTDDGADERLLALAPDYSKEKIQNTAVSSDKTLPATPRERIIEALKKGGGDTLEQDLLDEMHALGSAEKVVSQVLMQAMEQVGKAFQEGRMFLPGVVKSAREMKRAVETLNPYILKSQSTGQKEQGTFLLATVKGDVHDIGKNIVAVVLRCNNFRVVDLGVMVRPEEILAAAKREKADYIGLSGLISPSLEEMCKTARLLHKNGITAPLFIGGATTSREHTALKIAPQYGDAVVAYVKDAAEDAVLAQRLRQDYEGTRQAIQQEQEAIRERYQEKLFAKGRQNAEEKPTNPSQNADQPVRKPNSLGIKTLEEVKIEAVVPYISWTYFYHFWRVKPQSKEAQQVKKDALLLLDELTAKGGTMACQVAFYEAFSQGDAIYAGKDEVAIRTPRSHSLALSDFVAAKGQGDHIGLFAVTTGEILRREMAEAKTKDDYRLILLQSVLDRLAEATSEWLHMEVRRTLWGYAEGENIGLEDIRKGRYQGIRPAVGYPSLSDQSVIFPLADLLDIKKIGISLTENGAMRPTSSVMGLYIASKEARYFG